MPTTRQATVGLTEFLLARVTEDEAWATTLLDVGKRHAYSFDMSSMATGLLSVLTDTAVLSLMAARTASGVKPPNDLHQVLADCEAKRRILEEFRYYIEEEVGTSGYVLALRSLPLLALPYANHPDYREEWRPDADR